MSDYTKTTNFTAKDALSTGDPNKLIKGSNYDTEFDNIATAIGTKYDSNEIASKVQAEAETSNVVLVTPLRLAQWADYNAGMVGDVQALTDPGADTLLGWDDSASAAIGFTAGAGVVFSTTTVTVDHDAATNFVADEHIAHSGVSITAGTGLTGGGAIDATRTVNVGAGTGIAANANDVALSHLGLEALTDPGSDKIFFWDDSAGASKFLTLSSGLSLSTTTLTIDHDAATNFVANEHIDHSGVTITAGTGLTGGGTIASTRTLNVIGGDGITANANDIALTAASASTTNPVVIASGALSLDLTSLTNITAAGLAATDTIYIDDAGVSKGIHIQELGMRVQLAQTTQTLAAADMNTIMEFTGTATLTLPINSGVALPVGVPIVLNMKHATQAITVTAASSVTLVSNFHPGGGSAASDTVNAGGTALLYKTAADVWCISGDIST